MTRRLFVLAALVAAALSVLAAPSPASSAKVIRKCVPNVRPGLEVDGRTNVILFCGSARATVRYKGVAYRFSNGACYKAAGSLNVGIGKYTTVNHTPFYKAVYLVAPAAKDGTFELGVLAVQSKGKELGAAKVKVVVSSKRSRGTFTGTFRNGPKFTGSFTCK